MIVRPSLVALAILAVGTCPALAQVVLTENFNSPTTLTTTGGWFAQNNSTNPDPSGAWGPGAGLFDPPDTGPDGTYYATDTTATATANGTVSDWLLTPVLTFHNGDLIKFATRTRNPEEGPSRLEVRLSTAGSLTNVGTLPADVGLFNLLLGTVNPTLTAGAYPEAWTTFTFPVSGVAGTATGRIAFHTFYPNGGFDGPNGDTVGLDTVSYTVVPAPEPGTLALTGLGLFVIWRRRR